MPLLPIRCPRSPPPQPPLWVVPAPGCTVSGVSGPRADLLHSGTQATGTVERPAAQVIDRAKPADGSAKSSASTASLGIDGDLVSQA